MAAFDDRVYRVLIPGFSTAEVTATTMLEWWNLKLISVPLDIQRPLNPGRVKLLKNMQIEMLQTMRSRQLLGYQMLFVNSLVLVEYQRTFYVLDGQHRLTVLKELYTEGLDISHVKLSINYHYVGEDLQLFMFIYKQCGNTYGHEGVVAPNPGLTPVGQAPVAVAPSTPPLVAAINDAVKLITEKFGRQLATGDRDASCPRFNPTALQRELLQVVPIQRWTARQIFDKICQVNDAYGAGITISFNKSVTGIGDSQKLKCVAGFYLPYAAPHCRWVNKIRWDTPEQQG